MQYHSYDIQQSLQMLVVAAIHCSLRAYPHICEVPARVAGKRERKHALANECDGHRETGEDYLRRNLACSKGNTKIPKSIIFVFNGGATAFQDSMNASVGTVD